MSIHTVLVCLPGSPEPRHANPKNTVQAATTQLLLGPPGSQLSTGGFNQPDAGDGNRLWNLEPKMPAGDPVTGQGAANWSRINNGVKYGLSSSLYTRDINGAFQAMTDLDTGITYVNAPTIGAEAHLPFGGVKQTGNGHREGGWEVYDFYSETKTIYVDYSGTLQRAQIDTEFSP